MACMTVHLADPGPVATYKAPGRQTFVWAGKAYLDFCSSAWPDSAAAASDPCPPGHPTLLDPSRALGLVSPLALDTA